MTHPARIIPVLLLAWCGACVTQEPFPPLPGPGPTTGGDNAGADAAVPVPDVPDGGNAGILAFYGRVCIISDPRFPDRCAPDLDHEMTVRDARGTEQAISLRDGSVELPADSLELGDGRLVIGAGADRDDLVPSLVIFNTDELGLFTELVPVLTRDAFNALQLQLGASVADDQGSLLVYFIDTLSPYPLAGARLDVSAASGIYYDSDDVGGWALNGASGALGTAFALGLNPPEAALVVIGPEGNIATPAPVPVAADTITFVSLEPWRGSGGQQPRRGVLRAPQRRRTRAPAPLPPRAWVDRMLTAAIPPARMGRSHADCRHPPRAHGSITHRSVP
jgi:hypothetical protein